MEIGCCVPTAQYLQVVQDGYDYVEFPAWEVAQLSEEALDAICAAIKTHGVPCKRLNAYCQGQPAMVGPNVKQEASLQYAQRLMPRAARLGVECIGIGAPPARRLPADYDAELAKKEFLAFMSVTASVAQEYNICLLVEAIQKEFGAYMTDSAQALECVQTLQHPHVQLVLDLYHMEAMGESWDTIGDYLPWLRHTHVSTMGAGLFRGMYGPGEEEECQRTMFAIVNSGYDGTVSIEPNADQLTPEATRYTLVSMRKYFVLAKNKGDCYDE